MGRRRDRCRATISGVTADLLSGFWSVGASVVDLGAARLTHRPGLGDEPTATFLHGVRPATVRELDAVLDRVHEITGFPCPRVVLDGATPPWVEATLIVRDWDVAATVQLQLPDDRDVVCPDTAVTVRPAVDGDGTNSPACSAPTTRRRTSSSAGRSVRRAPPSGSSPPDSGCRSR